MHLFFVFFRKLFKSFYVCVCVCVHIHKPVLENLMPFKKKHTTISSAERIFNRTHCVPNIMNNTLFKPLNDDDTSNAIRMNFLVAVAVGMLSTMSNDLEIQ